MRAYRVLLALLLTASLLAGCGLQLLQTVYRVSQLPDPTTALPSWPVDMKLGLGEASVPVSDLIKSDAALPISTDSNAVYTLNPTPTNIDPIKLGSNLNLPAQASQSLGAPTIAEPDLSPSLGPFGFTVESLGIFNASSGVPQDSADPAGPKYTIGEVVHAGVGGGDPLMVSSYTFSEVKGSTAPLGSGDDQLRGAKLGANSAIVLDLVNDVGGTDKAHVPMTLRNIQVTSDGVDLNATWRAQHASVNAQTGRVTIALDTGLVISHAITINFEVRGEIQQGFHLRQLDDDQQVQVSVTPKLNIVALSLPEKALPATNQTIPLNLPAETGITELGSIKIATGSIRLRVESSYGMAIRLKLVLGGVKDSDGNPFSKTLFIAGATSSHAVTSDLRVSLDGATVQGGSNGATPSIQVQMTGNTVDTTARILPAVPPELALDGGMAFYRSGQTFTGYFQVSELNLDSVSARLQRSQDLPSSEFPVQLPEDFTKLGVSPSRISLQLRINNKSQIPGSLKLDLKARMPDGSLATVSVPADTALLAATTRGITRSTTLTISEQNSNLIDLLGRGATAIAFGGAVTISSGTRFVPVTRDDQISGKVAVSIPFTLRFKPMGPGLDVPPYDIKPASPLGFDAGTKKNFEQGLVSRMAITFDINNGLHVPLVLNALFSKTADPFSDPNPLVSSIALGDGTAVQTSVLEIKQSDMAFFKDAQTVGFRLTSPGTHGDVSLRSTDILSVHLTAELGLRVSKRAMQ